MERATGLEPATKVAKTAPFQEAIDYKTKAYENARINNTT